MELEPFTYPQFTGSGVSAFFDEYGNAVIVALCKNAKATTRHEVLQILLSHQI